MSSLFRMASTAHKFIDIGANMCDTMYSGVYHGSTKHTPDKDAVLLRAKEGGLERIIVTGTSLQESKEALEMTQNNPMLYCTVGCHPTRCDEFNAGEEEYLSSLLSVIQGEAEQAGTEDRLSRVVAVGECGLDYARTNFCAIDTQKKYFEKQLTLAEVTGLPLFLHCRDAASDLVSILTPWRDRLSGGVVHSFDGTLEELNTFLDLDLYIGINGCSLKTEENLKVASRVPLNRLMIETDSPWCEVKSTHAGYKHVRTNFNSITKKKEKWQAGCMVKGRNEPHCIIKVAEVLAGTRGDTVENIATAAYSNSMKLFFPKESIE